MRKATQPTKSLAQKINAGAAVDYLVNELHLDQITSRVYTRTVNGKKYFVTVSTIRENVAVTD